MPQEEIPKPATRTKRRLVPDLDASPIEVDGQTLTRVARAPASSTDEAPASEPALDGLDALARKHLGPHAAEVLTEHSEFLQALSMPEQEGPEIAEIAGRLELFSDTGAVPNPESAPDKRESGEVSPLIGTDDAPDFLLGRSQPETLIDLFGMFPQLDGVNWFIYVERLSPKIYGGVPCRGVLRRVTQPMTDADWRFIYGGGEYKLIVYGPPKRATITNADGRVSPKKLTEPILVRYPGAPSLESMDDDNEDPTMNQTVEFPGGRRALTQGDARVAEKQIDVSADREKRQEAKILAAQEEANRVRREQEQASNQLVGQFMQAQRESLARESALREQMLERERQIHEERRQSDERWEERFRKLEGKKQPDDVERLVSLASTMNKDGGGSIDALREEHAREIARLTEHRTTLETTHQRQLKDERDRADRLIQDERSRADSRIKDAEERFHAAERAERERAEREVARAKEEADRRVSDMDRQHNNRLGDIERNHARDLAAKDTALALQIQTLESTWTMRLESAKGDLKRKESEAERYKQESEENKDVVGKMKKLKEDAAELGMVDRSEMEPEAAEPETIGQMLAKAGGNLLSNLPTMVEHFAALARGKNQQELAQARELGKQEMIMQSQREGMGGVAPSLPGYTRRPPPRLPPIESVTPAPLIPGHEPTRRPTRAERVQPIPGTDLQPEEIMRREEEDRALRMSAPPLAAVPRPTAPPPPPVMLAPAPGLAPEPAPATDPAAYEASAQLRAEDLEIVQSEQILLPNYQAGATPEQLVAELAKLYSPEQIGGILQSLGSSERVIEAYQRTKDPNHPFLMREGKKFLRGLFVGLEKVARGR